MILFNLSRVYTPALYFKEGILFYLCLYLHVGWKFFKLNKLVVVWFSMNILMMATCVPSKSIGQGTKLIFDWEKAKFLSCNNQHQAVCNKRGENGVVYLMWFNIDFQLRSPIVWENHFLFVHSQDLIIYDKLRTSKKVVHSNSSFMLYVKKITLQ